MNEVELERMKRFLSVISRKGAFAILKALDTKEHMGFNRIKHSVDLSDKQVYIILKDFFALGIAKKPDERGWVLTVDGKSILGDLVGLNDSLNEAQYQIEKWMREGE